MFERIIRERPPVSTVDEIDSKLRRLRENLEAYKYSRVLITQEGAIRWLTGQSQQVIDIAPDSESPIWIEVDFETNSCKLELIGDHFEMNRLRGESSNICGALGKYHLTFQSKNEYRPEPPATLIPSYPLYHNFLIETVGPLLGGLSGNQYKKLSWLSTATFRALVDVAKNLTPGITGLQLKGRITGILNELGIEENLVLIGLERQESYLHPLARMEYSVPRKGMIKIAVGSRYADALYSGTMTIYIGEKVPENLQKNYEALRKGALEYADLYTPGAREKDIYARVYDIFTRIENDFGIPNFRESAYLHHLGGPLSGLGNRDYLVSPHGEHSVDPWRQFAVNPVDAITYTKVEIQGIVKPSGPPHILDVSRYCIDSPIGFTTTISSKGTEAQLPDILELRL